MVTLKQAVNLVSKYKDLFDLEEWQMNVAEGTKDDDAYAEVNIVRDYLKCYIRFNLEKIATRDVLVKTVVHELFHIFLSEYTLAAEALAGKRNEAYLHSLEETLVTKFERLQMWK
jgi:hypothetical protein